MGSEGQNQKKNLISISDISNFYHKLVRISKYMLGTIIVCIFLYVTISSNMYLVDNLFKPEHLKIWDTIRIQEQKTSLIDPQLKKIEQSLEKLLIKNELLGSDIETQKSNTNSLGIVVFSCITACAVFVAKRIMYP